jgi:multidrug efflux pump
MFARFFIDRPIFATVLSLLVTLGGIVGLQRLPVALYPEITPPTIEVSAVYPGANCQILLDTVGAPIEQQVNGVEGMMYMSSTSGNEGTYTLTITFKPGTDLNIAQVLVQNRVNLAERVLPDIVRRRGVQVKKKATGQLLLVNLKSPDNSRSDLYLSNYATIHIRDELARVEGVGDISVLGQRDYSMRVWLDPNKLAARNLTAVDAVRAVEQQNVQVAAGQIGQPPVPTGQSFQYTMNTRGRLEEPAEFANIILKTDVDGRSVLLKDVCTRIELGAVVYDQTCKLDGQPSVALGIYQLPGTNALETARKVKDKLNELRNKFPQGVDYEIAYDTTPFIQESVREVALTLVHAVLLVAIVMLVFLQSWRSAIIPLAAVPVAIIGTFGAMALAGYSLNALTLFGLVLAVGIVVDDAIVVVEAVEHHISEGLSPREATVAAMNEVAGPVIAVGLVLAAVFVPCLFIRGIIGAFFQQFAVTIAISTLLSAFNSLTLSPALCALLLQSHDSRRREPLPRISIPLALMFGAFLGLKYFEAELAPHLAPWSNALRDLIPEAWPLIRNWFSTWGLPIAVSLLAFLVGYLLRIVVNRVLGFGFYLFNVCFNWCTKGYLRLVSLVLFLSPLMLLLYGGLMGLTWKVFSDAPVGFVPSQDKGYFLVNVQLPDSASLRRTETVMKRVDEIARGIPGVRNTIAVAGQSELIGVNAPNFGTLYVLLDKFENRHGPALASGAIAKQLQNLCENELPGGLVTVLSAPPIDGLGTTGGLKLVLQERGIPNPIELQDSAGELVQESRKSTLLTGAFSGFRADTPWLELELDRQQAEAMGLSISDIIQNLQVYFGSLYVNDFNRFGRTWQVNLQADSKFRDDVNDPRRLLVRTRYGEMVSLAGVIKVREITGPVMITRYNLYPSVSVTVQPTPGVSTGDAIREMETLAERSLPSGMKSEWTELALLQLESGNTALWAFLLSVVLVFLVLAAQYESWALPLAVILVVPLCLLCATVGVLIAGQDVNIFTQVGFVVLIGLACKNAILIVEYARTRHSKGFSRWDSTIEACRLRLRPIVMTSVAFIIGVVPLIVAEGAGAEMRRLLGTAVFAGMLGVTLFGVFLTPVFFFTIQWLVDRVAGKADVSSASAETAGVV